MFIVHRPYYWTFWPYIDPSRVTLLAPLVLHIYPTDPGMEYGVAEAASGANNNKTFVELQELLKNSGNTTELQRMALKGREMW